MWYFHAISWCRLQTYRSNIRTVNIQMLIWRHIYYLTASLLAQCTFKMLIFHRKGVHVFVLTKLPALWFIFDLLLLHLNLLVSNGFLIFLFLYLSSFDYVFGCSQLNWLLHFKQCSVAPELSHFPFMLSCGCSIVLVITFSFVLPMFSELQLQFNV